MSNLEDIQAQKDEVARLEAERLAQIKAKKLEAKGPSRKELKELRYQQKQAIKNSMSEVEYSDMQLEKMRYFNNTLAYGLGYVGIAFSFTAALIALNTLSPIYFLSGFGCVIAILMNIVILLAGFLSAEKVKTYSEGYSKVELVLGGLSVLRIFWYPLSTWMLYSDMVKDIKNGASAETIVKLYTNKLGHSLIGGTPVDKNGIAITENGAGAFDHFITSGFLTANGHIRAIIMIVCLLIGAAGFIGSGIVGYTRARKLHKYLERINNK